MLGWRLPQLDILVHVHRIRGQHVVDESGAMDSCRSPARLTTGQRRRRVGVRRCADEDSVVMQVAAGHLAEREGVSRFRLWSRYDLKLPHHRPHHLAADPRPVIPPLPTELSNEEQPSPMLSVKALALHHRRRLVAIPHLDHDA